MSDEALDVLRRMLVFHPQQRATADELLAMPWFRNDPEWAGPIDYFVNQCPLPEVFNPEVEQYSMEQLQELVIRRCHGRTATFDSTVIVQQQDTGYGPA